MGRKIAIVGSGSSFVEAPWEDKSWEIWGMAQVMNRRADVLFEIHRPDYWGVYGGPAYRQDLARVKVPLFMREKAEDIPLSRAYPIERVRGVLGPRVDFSCTAVFMLALALTEAVEARATSFANEIETIGLWGLDLAAEDEYAYQRPAMCFLVGLADGLSIPLTIPASSSLCRPGPIYGETSEASPQAVGITVGLLEARRDEYEKRQAHLLIREEALTREKLLLQAGLGELGLWIDALKAFNRGERFKWPGEA